MNKPIYVVGGSKGGVGKSLVTMALVHYLKENDEEVFLIDADTSNPDVLKSYEEEVTCKLVNLDDADGWIQFVNICDEHRDCVVAGAPGSLSCEGMQGAVGERSDRRRGRGVRRGGRCGDGAGTVWAFHRVPDRRGSRRSDFVRYAGGAFCVRRSPRKGAEKTFVSVYIRDSHNANYGTKTIG